MIRLIAMGLGALTLASCATSMTPEQEAALQASANRDVVCQGADDCEVKWGRAVKWVLDNAAYRVQVQTDDMIQTAGPLPNDPRNAYVVNRVALGGGRYQFELRSGCDNMFGCHPSALVAKASFNAAVLGD